MPTHRSGPRWRLPGAGAVLAPLAIAAAALAPAATPALASCGTAPTSWPSNPRLVFHLGEMKGDTGSAGVLQRAQLLIQVAAAVGQFNAIGGTSARVTVVTTTDDPFDYRASYADAVPTIHVGFAPQATITNDNGGSAAAGLTSPLYLSSNCSPTRTIEFPDLHDKTWSFSSPFALASQGSHYYDAGLTAPTSAGGGEWFRTSFLHELLHGFGLHHTSTAYSMMNHRGASDPNGGFPWANRPDIDAVRPLPDEIGLLRDTYPASDTRWEMAVLNTWFHVTTDSEGNAADQVKLCLPSLGSRFVKDQAASGACGTGGAKGGSTSVAELDMLRTRFALANYSTGSMQVTSKLWLSKDDKLDSSDTPALTWDVRTVNAETSTLAQVAFEMPHLPAGSYHPIVVLGAQHFNAAGQVDPHSPVTDWIPLRGTVQVSLMGVATIGGSMGTRAFFRVRARRASRARCSACAR